MPFAPAALLAAFWVAPPADPAGEPPEDPIAAARAELDALDAELDAEEPADADAGNGLMPTGEAIALIERRIGGNPGDYANRTVLGQLLMRKAKEEDDHAAAARAVAVLREAVAANPAYSPARTYLAVALMANHGFAEALELARASAAEDRRDSLALATVGDALLELGRYEEAAASFAELEAKLGRTPAVLARLSRIAEVNGDPAGAAALIDAALADADRRRRPARAARVVRLPPGAAGLRRRRPRHRRTVPPPRFRRRFRLRRERHRLRRRRRRPGELRRGDRPISGRGRDVRGAADDGVAGRRARRRRQAGRGRGVVG